MCVVTKDVVATDLQTITCSLWYVCAVAESHQRTPFTIRRRDVGILHIAFEPTTFELPTLSFETFPEFTTYRIHAEQYVFVQITMVLLAS